MAGRRPGSNLFQRYGGADLVGPHREAGQQGELGIGGFKNVEVVGRHRSRVMSQFAQDDLDRPRQRFQRVIGQPPVAGDAHRQYRPDAWRVLAGQVPAHPR